MSRSQPSRLGITLLAAVTLAASAGPTRAQPTDFRSFLEEYAQALLHGSREASESFWWPEDLAHSRRLGLEYAGHGPKIDGASILVLAADPARAKGTLMDTAELSPVGSRARLELSLRGSPKGQSTIYHGQWTDGRWWLRHPLRLETEGWNAQSGEYLRLLRHERSPRNPLALRELDRFVERVAARLALGPEKLELLRRVKIDFVLGPEAVVHPLMGASAHGVANLQLDAVITQHAYHPHELAHILVNLAREEQPASVLPLLQEGLAVHLGGRFQSSAQMQKEFGRVLLRSGLIELGQLLTHDDFRSQPADMSYAPAALFVEYLMDELGTASFLRLYGEMSGPFPAVAAWSGERIARRFEDALGLGAAELEPSFRRYWMAREAAPIRTAEGTPTDARVLRRRDGAVELRLAMESRRAQLRFATAVGDSMNCALIWPQNDPSLPRSPLFEEHFPGRVHAGERFALVVAPGEVGFYDYGLDRLVAKRADGFEPDVLFWDAEDGVLQFDLRLSEFPAGIEAARMSSR